MWEDTNYYKYKNKYKQSKYMKGLHVLLNKQYV